MSSSIMDVMKAVLERFNFCKKKKKKERKKKVCRVTSQINVCVVCTKSGNRCYVYKSGDLKEHVNGKKDWTKHKVSDLGFS